jgi:hypothetical protein
MRKRAAIIFAGVLVALVIVMAAWHYFTKPAEPSFEGKTLTEWLTRPIDEIPSIPAWRAETRRAIRGMGTNTIPLMLEWFNTKDSRLQGFMYGALEELYPHKQWLSPKRKSGLSSIALLALEEKDVETLVLPKIAPLTNSPDYDIQRLSKAAIREYWHEKAYFQAHPTNTSNSAKGK